MKTVATMLLVILLRVPEIGFLLTFLLWVGFTVIGELLRPKPKFDAPQPSGVGDFTVPTAEEGRAIPILWGTCKVSGPNCVWYGDLGVVPITENVRTGIFSHSTITKGYRYYLGEQLALCLGPIDAVVDVLFDDRTVGAGNVVVRSDANKLSLWSSDPGGAQVTATIAAGSYPDVDQISIAASAAGDAALGGLQVFRALYPFHFIPGLSDELWFSIRKSGATYSTLRKANVSGIYPTGRVAARAVTGAMNGTTYRAADNATFPAEFSVSYDEVTGRFSIVMTSTDGAVDGWELWTYNSNSPVTMLGWWVQDVFYNKDEVAVAPFAIGVARFVFSTGFTGNRLGIGDPEMTAEALFALPQVADGIDHIAGFWSPDPPHAYIGIYQSPNTIVYTGAANAYFNTLTDGTIRIVVNAPDLFGGDDREGGIAGTIDVHPGDLTQVQDEYLRQVIGQDLPGYRGVCYAVFRHLYVGTTPYPKNPAFVLRRCPNQLALTGGHENINGDANPAAMLYELLTDARWGAKIPTASIDAAVFRAVGDVLFAEGLGLSMLVDVAGEAQDIATEILRHIDGVLFTDPTSGLITLKLARDDYNPDDLVEFSPTTVGTLAGAVSSIKVTRPTWAALRNTVKLKYVDRDANFTDRIVQAQDNAAIQTRDGVVQVEELNYRGISNATTAQKVAARALKALSYPLAAIEIEVNRMAWEMRPGSVFKLTWPALGISGMVSRVTRVSTGTLTDGKIRIDAVEDVFGVEWTAFTAPTGPEWIDPAVGPRALAAARLEEAPFAVVGSSDRKVMTLAARNVSNATTSYEVWSDPGGGAVYGLTNEVAEFTPFGLVTEDVAILADEIVLSPGPDAETLIGITDAEFAAGANVVLIEAEMVAWRDLTVNTDGTITISHLARGVMDTTPTTHANGAAAWFLTSGKGFTDPVAYASDGLIGAKLLPKNDAGTLAIGVADRLTCDVASRGERPYLPTAIQLNGDDYPATIVGQLVVSWSPRDRLSAWDYDDSGVTALAESGTVTRIKVYGDGGTLKHTEDVAAGTATWTYLTATEHAENGGIDNTSLRVVVSQVRSVVTGSVGWALNDLPFAFAEADSVVELESRQSFDWSFGR